MEANSEKAASFTNKYAKAQYDWHLQNFGVMNKKHLEELDGCVVD